MSRTTRPQTPKPPAERATVIVVDDDTGLRRALRYSLEIEGYQVVCCANAETLLNLTLPRSTACLVLDQRLPGMSGIEALEVLRGRQVSIPAIVITGSPDARLRSRLLLANARLIEKPLLTDHLPAAIRELIRAA